MKKRLFLWVHFAIFFLFFSWFFPPMRAAWDHIDYKVFKGLNHLLRGDAFWHGFWAVCNHRFIDWLHDLVMLSFFGYFIFRSKKDRLKRFTQLVLCITYFFLTIVLINKGFVKEVLHPYRQSPSIVYQQEAVCLSKEIDWIHVKDHSKTSYPSDHGTTAYLFAISIFYFMGYRMGIYATIYSFFFYLPRLVVGAHWLTDVFIGSLPIAFFSSSWILFTPIESLFTNALTFLLKPFIDIFKRKGIHHVSH